MKIHNQKLHTFPFIFLPACSVKSFFGYCSNYLFNCVNFQMKCLEVGQISWTTLFHNIFCSFSPFHIPRELNYSKVLIAFNNLVLTRTIFYNLKANKLYFLCSFFINFYSVFSYISKSILKWGEKSCNIFSNLTSTIPFLYSCYIFKQVSNKYWKSLEIYCFIDSFFSEFLCNFFSCNFSNY